MKKISLLAVVLCCSLAGQAQIPVLVQDINKTPVAADADPAQFIEYKGAMYFFANDGVHDHELWKYDETGSATMVADLNATGRTQPPHGTEPMVVYKSKLY